MGCGHCEGVELSVDVVQVEDEFDESHMDETVDLDDTGSDGPGYSDTDSSSADESTTEIEEEEEEGEGEGEGREEGEEPLTQVSYHSYVIGHGVTDCVQADAPPETADNVNSPSGGVVSGVEGGAGRVREAGFEADEEEEEDEVDEEEVDEDELDLEYSYDDEDEEDMADYLHVDVPWGLREYACAGTRSCMCRDKVMHVQGHGHACAGTWSCMCRS